MTYFNSFNLVKTGAPEGCIGVGILVASDGRRFDLVYRGRDAHLWDGHALSDVLDRNSINPLIAVAVADVGSSVWGQAWPDALALVTGIDRRRISRGRLEQGGLPPKVLVGLTALAESPEIARALGSLVIGSAYLTYAEIEADQWPLMLERARMISETMSD